MAQGRYADAIAEYREVVRLQPQSTGGYANLAAAYAADGQFQHAIETIDAALRLNPPEPTAADLRRARSAYLQRK